MRPTKNQGAWKQILTGKGLRLLQEASPTRYPVKWSAKEQHWECPSSPQKVSHSTPSIPLTSAPSPSPYWSTASSYHFTHPPYLPPSSSPFVCVLCVNLLFIQGSSWHDRVMLLKLRHSALVQKHTSKLLKSSDLSFLNHMTFKYIASSACKTIQTHFYYFQ